MKLYVDDIREAPDESWTLCKTITEAASALYNFGSEITEISLDHDISFEVRIEGIYRPFPSPDTFLPVAMLIGEMANGGVYLVHGAKWGLKVTIHSANPVGAERMQKMLQEYGIEPEIKPMGEAHRKK